MNTYAIQVQLSHSKWYWLEQSQFGVGYLSAGLSINSDTSWFGGKSEAEFFISECGIVPQSEILVLKQGANDSSEEIAAVRVVKIEAVEVSCPFKENTLTHR